MSVAQTQLVPSLDAPGAFFTTFRPTIPTPSAPSQPFQKLVGISSNLERKIFGTPVGLSFSPFRSLSRPLFLCVYVCVFLSLALLISFPPYLSPTFFLQLVMFLCTITNHPSFTPGSLKPPAPTTPPTSAFWDVLALFHSRFGKVAIRQLSFSRSGEEQEE